MRTLAFALGVPLLVAPGEPAPAEVDLLGLVPADAFAVVALTEVDALAVDLREGAWGRMWADDELAPVRDWLDDALELDDELDALWLELFTSIRGGAVAFAGGATEDELHGGVLIDPGPGREAFDEHFAGLFAQMAEAGEVEARGDVEILRFETAPSDQAALFRVEGLAAMLRAPDAEVLDGLIDGALRRVRGEEEGSLLDTELYREARDASSYARCHAFFDTHATLGVFFDDVDEDAAEFFDAAGLDRIRWATASFDVGAGEEVELEVRLDYPDGAWLEDLLDMAGTVPLLLAGRVPAEATSVSAGSFDLAGAVDSVLDLLQEIDPDLLGDQDPFEALEAMIGLDLRGEFLDRLTGDYASFTLPLDEDEWRASLDGQVLAEMGEDVPHELMIGSASLLGLDDPDTVSAFVEDLVDMAGTMMGLGPLDLEIEEVGDIEVFRLPIEFGEIVMEPAWYFGADYGAFSMHASTLDAALELETNEEAASVLDVPHFAVPLRENEDAAYVALAPTGHVMRTAFGLAGWFEVMADEFPSDLPLPAPEVADRYFEGTLVSRLAIESDSLVFSLFTR